MFGRGSGLGRLSLPSALIWRFCVTMLLFLLEVCGIFKREQHNWTVIPSIFSPVGFWWWSTESAVFHRADMAEIFSQPFLSLLHKVLPRLTISFAPLRDQLHSQIILLFQVQQEILLWIEDPIALPSVRCYTHFMPLFHSSTVKILLRPIYASSLV
jgi:hypothetical protein